MQAEAQEDLAILTDEVLDVKERFVDIDIGVFDYVLKCIEGPFTGRFIYISTAPEGEIVGGEDSPQLTMLAETADLSPVHFEIKFTNTC